MRLAAAVLRRQGRLRAVPLPVWAGVWSGGGRPDVSLIPALGRRLLRVDDARGLGEPANRPAAIAAGRWRQAALRAPAVTARGLARQLGITPQGALQLLNRLVTPVWT